MSVNNSVHSLSSIAIVKPDLPGRRIFNKPINFYLKELYPQRYCTSHSNLEKQFLVSAVILGNNHPLLLQDQTAEKEESKKGFDPETNMVVLKFLEDTTRTTLDKLKSLLPIPEFLAPLINMFLDKGTKTDVKVRLENGSLKLTAIVEMPAQGIQGIAVLSLPMTAQPDDAAETELHSFITDKISQVLSHLFSEKQQVEEITKLISTLPSKALKFKWSNGSAVISITLPNGAFLSLVLPASKKSETTPDILRTFLKSILKDNYAGIETLLSKDMIFNWNGSTSRFEIGFPQQLALHIKEISFIDISNEFLRDIVTRIGNNSLMIIPPHIRGKIDFKNPSIQFDQGTTFIGEGVPNITIDRISYNPDTEKMFLTPKVWWIPNYVLKDIEIDMKDSPEKNDVEKPNTFKYAFVPYTTKDVFHPETQIIVSPKSPISVFERLKQMIKIPKALELLIWALFAEQTKLDVKVGIKDSFAIFSVDKLNIQKLKTTVKASLKIPTQPQKEKEPATLPPNVLRLIEGLIKDLGGEKLSPQSLEEAVLFCNLFHLALTFPNQNIRMGWKDDIGRAELFITLPGGMELTLEWDEKVVEPKNPMFSMILSDVLKRDRFAKIEPFLSQTMSFEWNGEKKNAVLKLPNLGVTGQASIVFPESLIADKDKKAVQLHPQIKQALAKLMSLDSKSNSADLIDLIVGIMSTQSICINWMYNDKKACLDVTLPGGMILKLMLDMQNLGEENDILRTKLTEILGAQVAADIIPLLAQNFTFNWDGDTKKFKIEFLKEQNLCVKSMKFKREPGFFGLLTQPFMAIGERLTNDRKITLPKEIHGNVDFANASINFDEGTSSWVRRISFARENMIDIWFNDFFRHTIDTRTSIVEEFRIAIVEKDL